MFTAKLEHLWILFGLTLALAGCSRTSVYDKPVKADTAMNLSLWRSGLASELFARDWKIFDLAIQEHKYQAMIAGATGAEAVDAAWRERVHGVKLKDVLFAGLNARADRIRAERTELEEVIAHNARLRTHLDDVDSSQALEATRRTQAQRMERIMQDLAAIEDDLRYLEEKVRQSSL